MPFQMDFLAFVKSYFALALFFCVVWVILSQWDTFMMFVCFTYDRMDNAVHMPSGLSRDTSGGQHASGKSDSNTGATDEDTQMNGSVPESRKSVWGRFSAGLFLRRGHEGAATTAVEPAGLTAIVYV